MIFSALKASLILFAIIGLFFGPALVIEADAAKAAKVKTWKYGAKTKGIVCGDRLCSEYKR
jgi:hypothetical protein